MSKNEICGYVRHEETVWSAGNESHKPVASSASRELVNLRRSFSPDPALAQALPVPVGHADPN